MAILTLKSPRTLEKIKAKLVEERLMELRKTNKKHKVRDEQRVATTTRRAVACLPNGMSLHEFHGIWRDACRRHPGAIALLHRIVLKQPNVRILLSHFAAERGRLGLLNEVQAPKETIWQRGARNGKKVTVVSGGLPGLGRR